MSTELRPTSITAERLAPEVLFGCLAVRIVRVVVFTVDRGRALGRFFDPLTRPGRAGCFSLSSPECPGACGDGGIRAGPGRSSGSVPARVSCARADAGHRLRRRPAAAACRRPGRARSTGRWSRRWSAGRRPGPGAPWRTGGNALGRTGEGRPSTAGPPGRRRPPRAVTSRCRQAARNSSGVQDSVRVRSARRGTASRRVGP